MIGKELIAKLVEMGEYRIIAATSRNAALNCYTTIQNPEIEQLMKSEKIDIIVNLAFPRNMEADGWASGFDFACKIVELARNYGVDRFINISSQSLYGWDRVEPAKETDGVKIVNPYTAGKNFSESLVNTLLKDREHTNVRLASIVAPSSDERVVNKFLKKLKQGENLTIQGGSQIFSFLDVRDAVDGIITLIKADTLRHEIYNLGTSEYHTLLELANACVEIAGHGKITIEPKDVYLNNRIDVSRMKDELNFEAKYTMKDSLLWIWNEMNKA